MNKLKLIIAGFSREDEAFRLLVPAGIFFVIIEIISLIFLVDYNGKYSGDTPMSILEYTFISFLISLSLSGLIMFIVYLTKKIKGYLSE
jgi:hypothetical protein